jgi:hypothetical protein
MGLAAMPAGGLEVAEVPEQGNAGLGLAVASLEQMPPQLAAG